ncbi:unnamed protein product [Paramecium pentaurelia]|uniref:Uncharacterized protein n=1 Tax=Paramecium pentaurelia TaxID=43138 RepID=A0A8S1VS69_9CILI|nr:unnamed protein product [Paramecium pentaurelia]
MNIIKNIQKFIRLHKELILIYYYLLKRSKLMPYFLGILSLFVIVKLLLITNPRVKRNITVTGGSDCLGKNMYPICQIRIQYFESDKKE